MTVYTQDEYNSWIEQANKVAMSENDTEDPDRYWGWKWQE